MDYKLPKGTKDYVFQEAKIRTKIINIIEETYKKWGYQPIFTPALEMLSTLNAKSGEEIAGQIFKIENSDYGLRFDLTIGTARFVANTNIQKPYKRYTSGLVWRREEPQKGRLREFYQLDADIIGTSSPKADAEVIALSCEVLEKLGFKEYVILINNREIISALINKYNQSENENKILRILDKLDKTSIKEVKEELLRLQIEKKLIEEIFSLDAKNAAEINPAGYERIKKIMNILIDIYEIDKDKIKLDFSLARGLAYYTSTVFEIKLSQEIGSIAGGGRYDDLLSLYGKKQPAVGISFGLERLLFLIKQQNKIEKKQLIYILYMQEEYYKNAVTLAKKLRQKGINVTCDINEKKLSAKLKYAATNFKYVVIIGKKEIQQNKYTIKNLESGEQKTIEFEKLVEELEEGNVDEN